MEMRVRIGFVLLLCLAVVRPVAAQKQNLIAPVLGTTDNCEDAKARLDNVRILSGSDGIIILVARLGKGENQRKANHGVYVPFGVIYTMRASSRSTE